MAQTPWRRCQTWLRRIDELEAYVEGAVGLGGPAVAGGQRDSVLGHRSGDGCVVDGAAGDAERRGYPRV